MISLTPLPYSLSSLEPHMSEKTLSFHYEKHHAGYVSNVNKILQTVGGEAEQIESVEYILQHLSDFPQDVQQSLANNAGQVYNHTLFWDSIAGNISINDVDSNQLLEAIDTQFISIERFFETWKQAGTTLFGSGWVWLVKKSDGTLSIEQTTNADTPLLRGDTCIMVMDVWEHAYYLDYQNNRGAYIDAFMNCINWDKANKRYIS